MRAALYVKIIFNEAAPNLCIQAYLNVYSAFGLKVKTLCAVLCVRHSVGKTLNF